MAQMGLLFTEIEIYPQTEWQEKSNPLRVAFVTRRVDRPLFLPIDPQQRLPHGEADILLGRRQNAP